MTLYTSLMLVTLREEGMSHKDNSHHKWQTVCLGFDTVHLKYTYLQLIWGWSIKQPFKIIWE